MVEYTRPNIELVEFHDASGESISYGDRWAHLGHSPPEDSYSAVRHPERFAALHTVADALIDHLVTNCDVDVDVDEGFHLTGGMAHAPAPDEVRRALHLTPSSDASAPLTFVFTEIPGRYVQAGVPFTGIYPTYGCDACDEIWEATAEEVEWQVLAIVGGGFTVEKYRDRLRGLHGLIQQDGPFIAHSTGHLIEVKRPPSRPSRGPLAERFRRWAAFSASIKVRLRALLCPSIYKTRVARFAA